MEKIKKILKCVTDVIVFVLTGKGEIGESGVAEGILDYSGQGRNEYGR